MGPFLKNSKKHMYGNRQLVKGILGKGNTGEKGILEISKGNTE